MLHTVPSKMRGGDSNCMIGLSIKELTRCKTPLPKLMGSMAMQVLIEQGCSLGCCGNSWVVRQKGGSFPAERPQKREEKKILKYLTGN